MGLTYSLIFWERRGTSSFESRISSTPRFAIFTRYTGFFSSVIMMTGVLGDSLRIFAR